MNTKKDFYFIYAAFLISLVLLGFVFFQSQGIEGGMDSWNHFLISKSAFQHPELLLDQWNKPVFTWCTVFICQLGLNALIVFNILCVSFSGLLIALALKKQGHTQTWVLVIFVVFTPILFQNTISGLTEPLNVLFLSLVFYFWSKDAFKTAVAIASFLPFVRTEGFVICSALGLIILYKKDYSLLLWLILGSLIMNLVGWAITGKALWIITENPYWKHEVQGTFDAGRGTFSHYFIQSRALFGLPLEILLLTGNVLLLYYIYNKKRIKSIISLSVLVFWFYFMAHTIIYYFGILGSHGLTRVMAVIAPAAAILAFFTIDFLAKKWDSRIKNGIYILIGLLVIRSAYHESGYAKPYKINDVSVKSDKTHRNMILAGDWLIAHGLMDRPIIHQSPYFDVVFNKDPYNIKSSYRIWSIDQKNDWAEEGVIVIWDGFSAVREGNMNLQWLLDNPNYKLLHKIKGFEEPLNDPNMYLVCVFEKVGNNN